MKTDLTTLGSYMQSKARAAKGPATKTDSKNSDTNSTSKNVISPDYKVDLSSPIAGAVALASAPAALATIPKVELPKPQIRPSETSEIKKPEIEKPDLEKPREVSEPEIKAGTLKKPAIIFIKGLDVFSSPSTSEGGYAGVGKMAEAIEGSRIYGWDQPDEIIKEIKKRRTDQPVILIGHSLGGDTAHEVAEALDSLEHQFRTVDLLVTIDAVGADHDIISQNVRRHLNVFGESSFLLSDGPHVARRNELTEVKNILSPHDHTELDDDKEIQFEIMNLIQKTLQKS